MNYHIVCTDASPFKQLVQLHRKATSTEDERGELMRWFGSELLELRVSVVHMGSLDWVKVRLEDEEPFAGFPPRRVIGAVERGDFALTVDGTSVRVIGHAQVAEKRI
jgi:hypothetical protein